MQQHTSSSVYSAGDLVKVVRGGEPLFGTITAFAGERLEVRFLRRTSEQNELVWRLEQDANTGSLHTVPFPFADGCNASL